MISPYALGCYTDRPGLKNPGKGLALLELDEEAGTVREKFFLGNVTNPSYLSWDGENRLLLAAMEDGKGTGCLSSYRLTDEAEFSLLSRVDGPGRSNCHINRDKQRDLAYVTSYKDGHLKAYSMEKGTIGRNILDYAYEGKGPNEARQEQPHAHQAVLSPDKAYLYVADLGSDTLWIHSPDNLDRPPRAVNTSPGLGPRHMVFHPRNGRLYVVCELIPTLLVFDWNDKDGSLTLLQEIPTVEEKDISTAQPSGIKIHPSGKTVTLANRFTDTVTVFDLNGETGLAENREIFSGRGKHCRDLEFSPSGRWLMLAHQESCDIQLCPYNELTGRPEGEWGEPFETGSPTCIVPLTSA
ncbi:MAG: beta-propeller fold lactonase family protein [Spirochaetales bacterium]|nr:beta-propeller fold lactonase family protein [Spirochaetales bacterium]